MRSIERIKEQFYAEFVYRLAAFENDYMEEFRNFNLAKWEAPQRAARLSARVKNYKTSEMLVFVIGIAEDQKLDLTPLVVKRLNNALFGRTGSQKDIVALFGQANRVQRSKDSEEDRISEIANMYQESASVHWQKCLHDIKVVKVKYRQAVMNCLNET